MVCSGRNYFLNQSLWWVFFMEQNVLKTGTTTIGLVCKDCVILAADKRATAGGMIIDKDVQKVVKVNDFIAVTTAGTVSEIQLLLKYLRAEIKLKDIKTGRKTVVKEAANLMAGMVYSSIRTPSMVPGIVHFLMAGYDHDVHLFDIFPDGSITEIDDFIATGSGSVFAYGVLESSYKKSLSEKEGVELAVKAINAAIKRDTASGQGIDVFVISKKGINRVLTKRVSDELIDSD